MLRNRSPREWLPVVVLAGCLLLQVLGRAAISNSTANAQDDRIDGFLAACASDSESARSAAFYGLLSLGSPDRKHHGDNASSEFSSLIQSSSRPDQIRNGLVQLLQRENRVVQQAKTNHTRLSEGFLSYYGDLIQVVSAITEPSAIPALVGAIGTGNMATSALARFGATAIPAMCSLFASEDPELKEGALYTVSKLDWRSVQMDHPEDAKRIAGSVLRAAEDAHPYVRMAAVPAMKNINIPAVNRKLKTMSRNDPYRAPYLKGMRFPVREAAAKALREEGPAK